MYDAKCSFSVIFSNWR